MSNTGTRAYEEHISMGYSASTPDLAIAQSFLSGIPTSATAGQKADVARRLLR